jgi:hypothetical protein
MTGLLGRIYLAKNRGSSRVLVKRYWIFALRIMWRRSWVTDGLWVSQPAVYHEVTYSLRNVCLSTCREWRTAEDFVTTILLFVHKLVLITTKDSAPLLLAVQTLQFQIMGDKIKGILRVITEYCVRVLWVNLKLCICGHIRHLRFQPWTHSYGTEIPQIPLKDYSSQS